MQGFWLLSTNLEKLGVLLTALSFLVLIMIPFHLIHHKHLGFQDIYMTDMVFFLYFFVERVHLTTKPRPWSKIERMAKHPAIFSNREYNEQPMSSN